MAEIADLSNNGLEFLPDPVDRFPLREHARGVDEQDPLILMAAAAGQYGGAAEQADSGRKRKHSRAESFDSTGELNPDVAVFNSRSPVREVTADVEQPDPFVSMVLGPSTTVRAESSCAVLVGQDGGAAGQNGSAGNKKQSPTQSVESTGKVNPEAPGWTRRLRVGRAPPDRAPSADRITPLEESIRMYADKPQYNVMKPEIGMSFDSLREAYDFYYLNSEYNLYSWELGFGICYGKSRLNV